MVVKTAKIDGNKVRYLEEGTSKESLLLLHGLGASAERWEDVMPLFAKNYRVIVPDLIGFGYSDKPMVDYTTDYFAEFVAKFVDKVGIKESNIIGSSGIMKHSTPALDAYIAAALYPNNDSALNAFQTMSGRKDIDGKIISGFIERMQLPNAKMAFLSTLLGLSNSQVITEKLSMITVPTLIIWGESDPVIPIEYAQSFVSGINDCRFYKMIGCGHTPYVEKPKKFFEIVLDFLN